MTDQQEQVKPNGYILASTLLTDAINHAFNQGASLDEVFAALKVQAEVTNVKLAQAVLFQQQREMMAAQAAQQAAEAAPAEATENGAN